jgi:hypothetical protein
MNHSGSEEPFIYNLKSKICLVVNSRVAPSSGPFLGLSGVNASPHRLLVVRTKFFLMVYWLAGGIGLEDRLGFLAKA